MKLFYIGANFRYERPAAGRYRVHNQFGAEAFGIAEPEQDVECIELQMDFYRRAGLKDLALRINSLGDKESKERYRAALVAFLSPKSEQLSEDSKRRLTENPLRILDSKDPRDVEAVKGRPPATGSLSDKSKSHFEKVASLLQQAGIAFSIDGSLVRGFDYYTDTLWEVTAGGLGSQNAVGGGGRYDNLVEALGGRPTPGVGFGCGLERLLIALESQGVPIETKSKPLVWLVSIGDAARDANLKLLQQLRASNIAADMDPTGRSPKAQFKLADREKAAICLITGDSELANNVIEMKDMKAQQQISVSRYNCRITSRAFCVIRSGSSQEEKVHSREAKPMELTYAPCAWTHAPAFRRRRDRARLPGAGRRRRAVGIAMGHLHQAGLRRATMCRVSRDRRDGLCDRQHDSDGVIGIPAAGMLERFLRAGFRHGIQERRHGIPA